MPPEADPPEHPPALPDIIVDPYAPPPGKRRRKVDLLALNSAFMRVPGMKIEGARALLDLGLSQLYELAGRSPEALLADLPPERQNQGQILPCFRLAVYYAETSDPDPSLLRSEAWR
ncbi:MAG: hypothetical protein ACFCU4_04930 [Puniceicoccaceae bacterium]